MSVKAGCRLEDSTAYPRPHAPRALVDNENTIGSKFGFISAGHHAMHAESKNGDTKIAVKVLRSRKKGSAGLHPLSLH